MISLYFDEDGKINYRCSPEKTPLNFLLIAVGLCLGNEIEVIGKQKAFKKIELHFGNNTIKITCICKEEGIDCFTKAANSCYILKNLKFNSEVSFSDIF